MTDVMQMALSVSKCSAPELLSVELSGEELEEGMHMHTSRSNLHSVHLLQRILPLQMGSRTLLKFLVLPSRKQINIWRIESLGDLKNISNNILIQAPLCQSNVQPAPE